MKIVMICEFFNESLEYQENILTKYYIKRGHSVTIITSTFESVFDYYEDKHDRHDPGRTYYDGGAKIIKLPYRYNILNRIRAYTKIDHILNEEEPDLIYVHDIIPNFLEAARYVKQHSKCRMIMDYHADYSNSGKNWISLKILHGVLRKWFLDRARPHLQKIFPIVPASAIFLHEVYSVPYEEMELLPLGADTETASKIRDENGGKALRTSYSIPEDAIVIFTGGKLAPAKRTELLIEAIDSVPGRPPYLIVVGESGEKDREYKEKLVAMAGSNPRIRFVGWLGKEDVSRHLDMADIAVFPASQSILWQQAIAAHLPLIVGNSGHQDISYLNLHNNIIILDKQDIRSDTLAKAIDSVVNDPERMRKMAEGAKSTANEQLNWDRLIEKTLRFNVS